MANHNLAYDLATFESTSPRKREQEQVIRKVAKRSDAVVHPIKAILLIVLLVTITSSMILSMVQLTELNDQINQASAELSTQQSESVRLNLELNTAMSMNNVEDYAEKTLGLVKMEPSQVEYITLTKGNAIEIPQEQNAGFFEKIQQAFHNFLEYLAG